MEKHQEKAGDFFRFINYVVCDGSKPDPEMMCGVWANLFFFF